MEIDKNEQKSKKKGDY